MLVLFRSFSPLIFCVQRFYPEDDMPNNPRRPNPYTKKLPITNNVTYAQQAPRNLVMGAQTSPFQLHNNRGQMGIQSQKREGSIAAAKKRGTKHSVGIRMVQRAVDGGVAFDSALHCKVCKAKARKELDKSVKVPHDPHHRKCKLNRATKGLSERTVMVEKAAAKYYKRNNTLFFPGEIPTFTDAQRKAIKEAYFTPKMAPTALTAASPTVTGPIETFATSKVNTINTSAEPSQLEPTATSLRSVLDEAMKTVKPAPSSSHPTSSHPIEIGILVTQITKAVAHRRGKKRKGEWSELESMSKSFQQARDTYLKFFKPGTCQFTIPPDFGSIDPSPGYHSVTGNSIIYLDWQLIDPNCKIHCINCTEEMVHERTNWSKKQQLFPVWDGNGRPIYSIIMKYKCTQCDTLLAANDGKLLANLPPYLRSIYPVDPRFAIGTFHFTKSESRRFQDTMLTYGNAELVSKKMYQRIGEEYTDKAETYLSMRPITAFLRNEEFRQSSRLPPSGQSLRGYFMNAMTNDNTPYRFSTKERCIRELQSVEADENELCAVDWTFATLKNFGDKQGQLQGAKCLFTMNKGSTRELLHVAIVESTAVSQISHLLNEMKTKRTICSPQSLWSDITPSNLEFWREHLGDHLNVLLGLFHIMGRIVDTLNPRSGLYWEALDQLKQCFYFYNEQDFQALLACLTNGTFNSTREPMTQNEISQLRQSKRWKQRCDPYLRKIMKGELVIKQALQHWLRMYKDRVDPIDRPVFSKDTVAATERQMDKVQYATEICNESVQYYTPVPPGKRSPNQLTKWKAKRPESHLEKLHESLAHYGNTGMNPQLAEFLTLLGIAERNVKCRWVAQMDESRIRGEESNVPLHFADLPPYLDHSLLLHLNAMAEEIGHDPIFTKVTPIVPENNGEKFLVEYFKEQKVRNQTQQQGKTKRCACSECKKIRGAPEKDKANHTETQATETQAANNSSIRTEVAATALPPLLPVPYPPVYQAPQIQNHFRMPAHYNTFGSPHGPNPIPVINMRPPPTACFLYPPFHCAPYAKYLEEKKEGKSRMGRPSHEQSCPIAINRRAQQKKKTTALV